MGTAYTSVAGGRSAGPCAPWGHHAFKNTSGKAFLHIGVCISRGADYASNICAWSMHDFAKTTTARHDGSAREVFGSMMFWLRWFLVVVAGVCGNVGREGRRHNDY